MSTLEIILIGVYACVLVVWLTRHQWINRVHSKTPFLTRTSPGFRDDDPPLVSIIIPAKDEEDSIGECVLSVLEQSYVRLEVIVVDDRSTDGTTNVVREIAARDPRVRLVSVNKLPSGWTGKNNALATGVREAHGDWLLFIDSDTRHAPENLSAIMEFTRREQADMVSILPRWRNGTFWERVAQPLGGVLLMIGFPVERVNEDTDLRTAFANGQYILIRRTTYDAIGGHAAVRDKFVEDIHLARLAKTQGHRIRLVIAPELTSTRMYTSLAELARGWSRILYAGYDCSALRLAAVLGGLLTFSLSAYVCLAWAIALLLMGLSGAFVWTLFGMGLAHLILQSTVMARVYAITDSQRSYVAFYGAAAGIMVWVLGSALRKCFTHRVVWRGTSYHRLEEAEHVLLPLPVRERRPATGRRLKKSA